MSARRSRLRQDDGMSPYTRPSIAPQVFVDADGEVIDYGHRWSDSPPAEAYSVTVHPERYAPLHAVAAALIDHLRLTYDVEVDDGAHVVADLLAPPSWEVPRAVGCARAIRVRSLTFVFTSFPGLLMHAACCTTSPSAVRVRRLRHHVAARGRRARGARLRRRQRQLQRERRTARRRSGGVVPGAIPDRLVGRLVEHGRRACGTPCGGGARSAESAVRVAGMATARRRRVALIATRYGWSRWTPEASTGDRHRVAGIACSRVHDAARHLTDQRRDFGAGATRLQLLYERWHGGPIHPACSLTPAAHRTERDVGARDAAHVHQE